MLGNRSQRYSMNWPYCKGLISLEFRNVRVILTVTSEAVWASRIFPSAQHRQATRLRLANIIALTSKTACGLIRLPGYQADPGARGRRWRSGYRPLRARHHGTG